MDQLKQWIDVFSALLTPLIAIAVCVIAYWQWRTAHARLLLDLFEKRLAIYAKVQSAVRSINSTAKVSRQAERDLLEAIDGAAFLFGHDVRKYLDNMWELFINLNAVNGILANNGDPEERKSTAAKQSELFTKITRFYYDGSAIFAPYMRLDHRIG